MLVPNLVMACTMALADWVTAHKRRRRWVAEIAAIRDTIEGVQDRLDTGQRNALNDEYNEESGLDGEEKWLVVDENDFVKMRTKAV